MTAIGRLFWIESRRSLALLAFPALVGLAWLAWYIRASEREEGLVVWPEASVQIGFAAVLLGPAAGGLAAWAAGRDRRRGMDDLLATTPRPATTRDLNLLGATALWAILAYLATAAYLGWQTTREATWGGPVVWPLLVGGLTIAVDAAIGYAVGTFAGASLTSRLTAALVPVLLFAAQLIPGLVRETIELRPGQVYGETFPYRILSPWWAIEELAGSAFWAPDPALARATILWLVGLTGLGLAAVALRRRRDPIAFALLGVAIVPVAIGWARLVPAPLEWEEAATSRAIAYTPVCVQRAIEICLHPAYEAALDETADLVDGLLRPVAGIPGAPVRAEQNRPVGEGIVSLNADQLPDGTLAIVPLTPLISPSFTATMTVVALFRDPDAAGFDMLNISPAELAIGFWLLGQAGWAPPLDTPFAAGPWGDEARFAEIVAAADRFAALPPETQRAWLDANFTALRAGHLTLADLP